MSKAKEEEIIFERPWLLSKNAGEIKEFDRMTNVEEPGQKTPYG